MLDVESAFDKLNGWFYGYIGEIDGKKKKTVTMLRKLQILMEADKGLLNKTSTEVQTDESHLSSYMAGELRFNYQSYFTSLINVK